MCLSQRFPSKLEVALPRETGESEGVLGGVCLSQRFPSKLEVALPRETGESEGVPGGVCMLYRKHSHDIYTTTKGHPIKEFFIHTRIYMNLRRNGKPFHFLCKWDSCRLRRIILDNTFIDYKFLNYLPLVSGSSTNLLINNLLKSP